MRKYALFGLLMVLILACEHSVELAGIDLQLIRLIREASPTGSVDYYVLPDEDDFSNIPQEVQNPLNTDKVNLGKFLFHETGIGLRANNESGMTTYSCASCHLAASGFKPGRQQGIADGGVGFGIGGENRTMSAEYEEFQIDAQAIRPLSVLNVAFVSNTLWNGQFGAGGVNEGTENLWGESIAETEVNHTGLSGLEAQNIEGLELHRMFVDKEIATDLGYKKLFDGAFPEILNDSLKYSNYTASLAISAYLRTLLSTKAPFQEYLKNDYITRVLSEEEKRGALLFFGKAGCVRCHNGPSFSSMQFHAVGVNDLYEQAGTFATPLDDKKYLGRGGFTERSEDMYKFKVPHLYNLKHNEFYFHGSSKTSIRDVVEYFNEGIPENDLVPQEQISHYFQPLDLSQDEVDQLTLFLEKSLYDPYLQRYVPSELPSGNCFPNADEQSLIDLGCE